MGNWVKKSVDILKGFRKERGVTLLELTVVGAVLAALATMTAVGVTGQATNSRNISKINDISEVQKSVDSYRGEHPQGNAPTLTGGLPSIAFSEGNSNSYMAIIWGKAFVITTDVNGDGDSQDEGERVTKYLVAPAGSDDPSFHTHPPKHAFEHTDETVWSTVTVTDPEGVVTAGLRAPTATKTPVWVLDWSGKIHMLPEADPADY